MAILSWAWLVLTALGHAALADDSKNPLDAARAHLAKGRYEEALETFHDAAEKKADPVAVAIGRSQAHEAIGQWDQAEKCLDDAAKAAPANPLLLARRAQLHLLRGRYSEAVESAESALKSDRDQPLARLVLADVAAESGRFEEANEACRWFIRFYNDRQPEDAATLLLIARGSVQYARWNRNTQVFQFVVNTLCPDALKSDPDAWQAAYLSGALLLEKYNRQQAIPDLQRAMALNPRAAEVIVLLGIDALDQNDLEEAESKAGEALRINPRLPSALRLKADVCLAAGRTGDAAAATAAALAVNPRDPLSLARAAVSDLLDEGLPEPTRLQTWLTDPSRVRAAKDPVVRGRFSQRWADISSWNPKPGVFLTELGRLLEGRRRLEAAEICYRRAMAIEPQLSEPKTRLGMHLMRLGKLEEARKILDEAFKADPYQMRVSNFRKVLKLLDGYQVITTDHFVIRVDSQLDKLLGGYMAEYLEEIYPQLVEQFGFAPPQRTQFEIFNNSGGVSGHEWFSARMVGLPWIHTIGASTGVVVAMASPTSAAAPFNWARVVRHEFVHVITVQESRFNIPQWFTEALAVLNEGYPAPASWNGLLAARVAGGNLRTLDTLDRGFQKPANSDDWQFAYYQSRLYAEYMIERGGKASIHNMLQAYRENLATPQAIKKVFGVDLGTFERGYREFLNHRAAGFRKGERPPSKSVKELEQDYAARPDDAAVAGAYSWVLLEAGNRSLARIVAKKGLEKNPREPWAAIVLARLDAEDQRFTAAIARIEPLLDRRNPHRELLLLLAKLKLLDDKPQEAAALCELGVARFTEHAEFLQGLAAAYSQLNDGPLLAETLTRLCELLPDDAVPRKRLTELALAQKRHQDAVRFAKRALQIAVLDADAHRQLGEAYLGVHDAARALPELEAADRLKPKDAAIEVLYAGALIAAGKREDAQTKLQEILQREPQNAEARALLESLK